MDPVVSLGGKEGSFDGPLGEPEELGPRILPQRSKKL